jgi:hypothetical protein
MLMGAVTLATGWQMTENWLPVPSAKPTIRWLKFSKQTPKDFAPSTGEIPAELFLLAMQQQQNNNCSLIVPPALFFGLPTLKEFHAIMNSLIHIQEGIEMSTTQGYTF